MAKPIPAGRRVYSTGFPLPDLVPSLSQSLTRFTHDNLPISNNDVQLVQEEILPVALGNLAVVNSRLEELQAELLAMAAEQNRWQITVDHCRGALSPLRRLPTEILEEIFQIFCSQMGNIVDILDGPWLLGHVCSLWRCIVVSTPNLWTHITVCNSFQPCAKRASSYPPSFTLLHVALSRSGDLPLNISFENYADTTKVSQGFLCDRFDRLLEQLMDVAERWQHCTFYLLSGIAAMESLDAVKGRLNSLETLKMKFSSDDRLQEFQAVDCFEVAPKLRSVELYAVDNHEFILPHAQLVCVREHWVNVREHDHVGIFPAPVDSFRRYLLEGTQLDEFHLVHFFAQRARTAYDGIPMMVSHRLRSLTISDPLLLNIVELPCLEALDIKTLCFIDFDEQGEWPCCPSQMYAPIAPFLRRSRCSLKCLKVTEPEARELHEILRLTPLLERLKLRYTHWGYMDDSDIPELLAVLDPSQNADVLPNLQSLVIRLGAKARNVTFGYPQYVAPWFNEALCTAVANRHGQLRKLLVTMYGFGMDHFPGQEQFLDALRKCKSDGMDISVLMLDANERAHEFV